MAAGKVITGYSKPYVALYSESGGTVTYSNGQRLARGVDFEIVPDVSEDNDFHADNILAESVSGIFTSGTATFTVDGLKNAAEKMIMGLPTAKTITVGTSTVNYYEYGDDQEIPYVGVGVIIRYMEEGTTTYAPLVLTKCKFNEIDTAGATQGSEIEWQTQKLTALVMRDDTSNHNWKKLAEDQTTETEAESVLKAFLGITA